jgi:hypothetical protein
MKSYNWRVIIGVGLLVLGFLALFQTMGLIVLAGSIWGLIFGVAFLLGGIAFLMVVFNNRANWWALIPGIILVSLGLLTGLSALSPTYAERIGGVIFLGGISLSFWLIFILNRHFWWAIIPGGVLASLAVVSGLENQAILQTGSIFFVGLAITFALLAVLPPKEDRMDWPWIPAVVLLVIGILTALSAGTFSGIFLPLVLIVLGGLLLVRALRRS